MNYKPARTLLAAMLIALFNAAVSAGPLLDAAASRPDVADPPPDTASAPADAPVAATAADGDAATQPARNIFGLEAAPLDEPMVTDRPDFTESALAVPRGRIQLESGYTFSYDREDNVRTTDHVFPEILLRVGLADDLELRLAWAGWSITDELFREKNDAGRTVWRNPTDRNGTDMSVGFKQHLWKQDGLLPEFGVIGELSLPAGASGKTSGDVDPTVKLLWAYDLSERWALSGNVNLSVPTSDGERFFQTAASVSLGCEIFEWLGAYVEYFGFYPNDVDSDCAHYLNGGFTVPITDNLQFDVRAGFGLNEEADDLFTGAGFAIRF